MTTPNEKSAEVLAKIQQREAESGHKSGHGVRIL